MQINTKTGKDHKNMTYIDHKQQVLKVRTYQYIFEKKNSMNFDNDSCFSIFIYIHQFITLNNNKSILIFRISLGQKHFSTVCKMFTLKYYNNYNGFHYRCYNNHIFFTSTQKYRQSNNFQQESIDYILIEIIISIQNVKLFLLINCYTVPDICN